MSCYVMLWYGMVCYVMLCYFIKCYVMYGCLVFVITLTICHGRHGFIDVVFLSFSSGSVDMFRCCFTRPFCFRGLFLGVPPWLSNGFPMMFKLFSHDFLMFVSCLSKVFPIVVKWFANVFVHWFSNGFLMFLPMVVQWFFQ